MVLWIYRMVQLVQQEMEKDDSEYTYDKTVMHADLFSSSSCFLWGGYVKIQTL